MKKLLSIFISSPTTGFYNNIGKPEQKPQDTRISHTVVPENKPLDVWMDGYWGRYSFHMANYKLQPLN